MASFKLKELRSSRFLTPDSSLFTYYILDYLKIDRSNLLYFKQVHDTVEESIFGLRRQKLVNLPGPATSKPDVYNLTLKDLSSLFAIQTAGTNGSAQVQPPRVGTFEGLTPARAAAAAAEARLMSSREP